MSLVIEDIREWLKTHAPPDKRQLWDDVLDCAQAAIQVAKLELNK